MFFFLCLFVLQEYIPSEVGSTKVQLHEHPKQPHPLPSGKRLRNYGKSQFVMVKSTKNGHFQVCKLLVYQRVKGTQISPNTFFYA